MGGQREDTIQSQKPEKSSGKLGVGGTIQSSDPTSHKSTPLPTTKQSIRFHENKGEVHFHDDAASLKVAMPVAEWWSAWNRLKNFQVDKWCYLDRLNGSILEILTGHDDQGRLELRVSVKKFSDAPVQIGSTFAALEKFTENK